MGLKDNKVISRITKVKWLRIIGISIVVVGILVGGFALNFVYNIYESTEDFDVSKLYSGEASKMYDEDKNLVYTWGDDINGKRNNVTYDDLPQVLIDAVVSAEDSRYFEHNGMDIPRLFMAAINQVTSGFTSGGGASTITQQIIKQSYNAGQARTIPIKIGEMFLAIDATKETSKEEIITLYLNKIYFGATLSSIGIDSASSYYFNKDVSELTLPEAALLAGTLNSPVSYDPYYNIELATNRRDIILDLMLYHGYITEEECSLAKEVKVHNMLDNTGRTTSDNAFAAYIDIVDQEVRDLGIDPTKTQIDVYTHLKPQMQQEVYDVIEEDINFPNQYLQTAFTVQDVDNGRVLAVVGGRGYNTFDYNRAAVKQQPGSSIKPIIDYAAAYEFLDWSTAHTVEDKEYNKNGYNPKNYDGGTGTHGLMSVTDALYNSWNTCAVWTLDSVVSKIGAAGVYNYLEGFKVDMSKESYIGMGYGIGGWDAGLSPMESANMYAAISNGGTAYESHTVDYISFASGEEDILVDEKIQSEASRAMSAETAFMIKDTQLSYMRRGSYGSYLGFGNICAKTGTSNWGSGNAYGIRAGQAKDFWVASYNPDYAVSVWLGYDYTSLENNPPSMSNYYSLRYQITSKVWKVLTKNGVENSYPAKPSSLSKGSVVKGLYPYVKPSANTPSNMILTGWFKPGTYPSASLDSVTCGTLDSFSASIGTNGIDVAFSKYDPIQATIDEDFDTYTTAFGLVTYTVDVLDAETGEKLHTQALNVEKGTIAYVPTKNVIVKGYYSYANANSIRSNEVDVSLVVVPPTLDNIKLNVASNGTLINSGTKITTGNSVVFNVLAQNENSKITFDLYNATNELLTSSSKATFTHQFTTPGTYVIHVNEEAGTIKAPTTHFTIIVEDPAPQVDDDDDDSDENTDTTVPDTTE